VKLTGLRQADYGWLAVAAVVVAAEVTAGPGEMLSHGAARYKAAHPVLTTSVVVVTAAHLLEWLPQNVDPYHCTYGLLRFLRQKIHPATPARITAMSGT
jgi:hypothetical protein